MSNHLNLADNRRALAAILVPTGADRVTRFAAGELARYLRRITGATFRVQEVQPGATLPTPALLVGTELGALGGNYAPESGLPDSFTLTTQGGRLYLWGNRPRAALYAVYALLETLGCRFIEPGIETVPRVATLQVPALRRRETAGFAVRNVFRTAIEPSPNRPFPFLDAELHLPQIDWMAKRRLNHYEFYVDYYRYDLWEKHKAPVLDALLDRGFDLEVTHHSLHYFCPPDENHDFGNYGPETYERNHPDWYLPAYECGSRGRWQTNVGIPAVQEVVFERYLDYRRRNPELKIVGLWPDDVPMNAPYRGLSRTDGYHKFWNRLARLMAKEMPDKLLGTIAYFEIIDPPQKVTPASNLHCWYCPISLQYMYPVSDRRNREFLEGLGEWCRKMPPGRVPVFEYYCWLMPMTPSRLKMVKDLPVYRDLGVGGIYGWAGFTHNIMGQEYRWAIDLYALTELLWNPKTDLRVAEQAWASGVYGPAAEGVLEFYRVLEDRFRKETRRGLVSGFQWVALDLLHAAQERLATARKAADTAGRKRRVDLLEKWTAYGCTNEVWREGPPRKYIDT